MHDLLFLKVKEAIVDIHTPFTYNVILIFITIISFMLQRSTLKFSRMLQSKQRQPLCTLKEWRLERHKKSLCHYVTLLERWSEYI